MKKSKNKIFNKKNYPLLVLLLLAFFLLIIARLLNTPTNTRQEASGNARLYFTPSTSSSTPIQKNINDTITLNLMVDPGSAMVSFIRFDIEYDSSKLSISGPSAVQINTSAFPATLEGPVLSSGKVAASVSVGSDPTKTITSISQVASITFTASAATNEVTQITFGEMSQILSIDANNSATDNVLGTTIPAYIQIGTNLATSTPPIYTPTPPITNTPPVASPTPPSGTPDPTKTTLTLSLLFHGIGSAGDTKNPDGEFSNKIPINQERTLNVQLVNEDNQLVATKLITAFYNSNEGTFDSHYVLNDPLPKGDYILKVKTEPYLRKLMPGFMTVEPGKKNIMEVTELITGDINGDNVINVLDYNILFDCGYGAIDPLPIVDTDSLYHKKACVTHSERKYADLTDNGIIDSTDYNLFIRELSSGFGQ